MRDKFYFKRAMVPPEPVVRASGPGRWKVVRCSVESLLLAPDRSTQDPCTRPMHKTRAQDRHSARLRRTTGKGGIDETFQKKLSLVFESPTTKTQKSLNTEPQGIPEALDRFFKKIIQFSTTSTHRLWLKPIREGCFQHLKVRRP